MGCIPGKLSLCSTKKAKRKESAAESASEGDSDNTGGRRSFKPTEGLRAIIPIIQSASLLAQATISTSQSNFFQMLDEKIEQGRELDSQEEKEEKKERMDKIVKEWEKFLETRPTPQQMYNSCHLYTPNPPSPSPRSVARGSNPKPKTPTIKIDRNFSKDSLDSYSICSDAGNRLVPRREDDGNISDDSAISIKIHNCNELIPPEQRSRHSSNGQVPLLNDPKPHSWPTSSHFEVEGDSPKLPGNTNIGPPELHVAPTETYDNFSRHEDFPEAAASAKIKLVSTSVNNEAYEGSLEDALQRVAIESSAEGPNDYNDQKESLENDAQQGDVLSPLKQNTVKDQTGCANDEGKLLGNDTKVEDVIIQTRSSDALMQTEPSSNGECVQEPEMVPRKNSGKFCNVKFKKDSKRRRSYPPGGAVIFSSRAGKSGKKMNGGAPPNLLNGTVVTSNRLLLTTKRSLSGRRSSYGGQVTYSY